MNDQYDRLSAPIGHLPLVKAHHRPLPLRELTMDKEGLESVRVQPPPAQVEFPRRPGGRFTQARGWRRAFSAPWRRSSWCSSVGSIPSIRKRSRIASRVFRPSVVM
jgi:hypothetical protein